MDLDPEYLRLPSALRKCPNGGQYNLDCSRILFPCLQCMDLDPEYLPRRLLTDFSIYNAEVRCCFWPV